MKLKENKWLIAVMCLILWSVVSAQLALHRSNHNQDCSQNTLADTLDVLGDRSTIALLQTNANKELQKAQASYIRLVLKPHATRDEMVIALNTYFNALNKFVEYATTTAKSAVTNPYPDSTEFRKCLNE